MRTIVTAIVVAQQGGEWLEETLAGIAAQTRRPDRVIAVNNGGAQHVTDQLAAASPDRVIGAETRRPFGETVQRALDYTPAAVPDDSAPAGVTLGDTQPGTAGDADAESETDARREATADEWIWLLAEDTCPEPEALQRILSTVERAPSVAVAGPKLLDWDRPRHIIELGQSLTRFGSRWKLRRQELDQQQYDHLQDVLGVGPAGMLVRRDVWEQLGGFDPSLPVVDDGLDFSVRARLAGYRVVVAPSSRVRFAQSGVVGPRIERKRGVMRAAHRRDRAAQMHRRIAYAPAFVAFFLWLGLPAYAVLRMFWALIREQPGQILGEFTSAMYVFFRPASILASRRRIKRTMTAGWPAVTPLRIDPKSVRTARMIDREAILLAQGRQRKEMHFISTGGLAVLVGALVIAAALCWWALPQVSLSGGALAPLSPIGELWTHTRTIDGLPADPFTWVLAVLGTLTFWNPSHAIVLLIVAAIPLAALGGWIWSAQLTDSRAGRTLLGIGVAISPVMLASLDSGRLPTLILSVVLPWLLLAATRCRESWSWAGTASLLAAVALACAPILIPAALLLLIVGIATSPRRIARVLSTAIAPAALFAPKIVTSVLAGRPLDIFLDPGITPVYEPGNTWHLILGFPEFGLAGWSGIFEDIGLSAIPTTVLVGILLLPLALLALLGLYTGRIHITILSSLMGGLGMLTAVAASQLRILVSGPDTVALWTGSGLAVYWIAVLGLAVVGAQTLRRAAGPVVAVALVAAAVAVAPNAVQLMTASSGLTSGTNQMPALVQAAGGTATGTRTLVIDVGATNPSDERSVGARIVDGTGERLDDIRTASRVPDRNATDEAIAELVGGLASTGDVNVADHLRALGVGFVLLSPGGDSAERAELQAVFDQNAALTSTGQTDFGLLWRATAGDSGSQAGIDEVTDLEGTTLGANTLWWAQVILVLSMLLLALPTGEVVERPPKRKRPSRRRAAKTRIAVGGGAAATAQETAPTADPADADADAAAPETDAVPETDAAPDEVAEPETAAEPDAETDPAPELAPEAEPAPEPTAPDDAPGEPEGGQR